MDAIYRRRLSLSAIRQGAMPAVLGSLSSAFVSQALLVVSGIVFARLLGPEGRGYLALFVLLPLIISQLGGLGLPVAIAYYVAQRPRGAASTILSLRWLAPALCSGLFIIHFTLVVALFGSKSGSVRLAALASLVAVPAFMAQEYGLAILQGKQRFSSFNTLRAVPSVLNSFVAVALWRLGGDLFSITALVMLSGFMAGLACLTAALWGLERNSQSEPGPGRRSLLRFSLQSFIGSAYPAEAFRPEQLLIASLLSPAALGIYVAALSFSNLPRFVAQSLGMIAYPKIAMQISLPLRRRLVWRYFWASTALVAGTVVGLECAVGILIPFLFGNRFVGAVPVTRVLLIGAFLLSERRILAEGLRGAGFPTVGTVAEVASWFALGGSLMVLAPRLGLTGVAIAVTISGATSLGVVLFMQATRLRGASDATPRAAEEVFRAPG